MNRECGRPWTRRFLNATFSQSFLNNDWRQSREKLAFDRETAQLPASQEILERRLRMENVHREITLTRTLIKNAQKFYHAEFKKQKIPYPYMNEPEDLRNLRNRLDELQQSLYARPAGRFAAAPRGAPTVTHFVRACPSEDCRGFLSKDWKCGLCKVESCSKCHVIKNVGEEHTCNPDDVATATLLNKDTKPCPKCHTGIFKIDGCDQMWCTQCHTAFSWRTGDIETRIHNPHFYEWQRRTNGGVAPRVPGDAPHQCGQDPLLTQYDFRHIIGLQLRADINSLSGNIIRDVIHLRETEMREFLPAGNENVFLENRIFFLKKDISKETFVRRVLKESKKREIHAEIHQVLQMFVQASTDIIRQFMVLAPTMRDEYDRLKLKLDEIETLRQFTNEALKEIYTTFKYTPRQIVFINEVQDRSAFVYRDILKTVDNKKSSV
jgi:tetrahydromethanopterin S-methyltransferase subunit G